MLQVIIKSVPFIAVEGPETEFESIIVKKSQKYPQNGGYLVLIYEIKQNL